MGHNGKRAVSSMPKRAPAHLSARSRRVWAEVVDRWELDPTAVLVLEGGLGQWDLYDRARRELARAATLTSTSTTTGVVHAHPAVAIARDALAQARQAFRQLGLELPDADRGLWPNIQGRHHQ